MAFVVDRGIQALISQFLAACPEVSRSEVGTIGDADHQTRTSAHNPEDTADSSDGNDPDDQVDACDLPHDPSRGADMAVLTESLRRSKDQRLRLIIFNGRQFSNYWRDGIAPYTWRPYTGSNPHEHHAHVEVNDVHNDEVSPVWQIGIGDEMADSPQLTTTNWRVYGLAQLADTVDNHVNNKAEPLPLAVAVKRIDAQTAANGGALSALAAEVAELKAAAAEPVDLDALADKVADRLAAKLTLGFVPVPPATGPTGS
jgi:hypothetical protein